MLVCASQEWEKKYLEMTRILYRACKKTMLHEFDAVKNAFKTIHADCGMVTSYYGT
jgi:hypothetical protein